MSSTDENEQIYLWLVCKICNQLHQGDPIPVSPDYPRYAYPVSMAKTGQIECPDNPGKLFSCTQAHWKAATESDIDKLVG